MSKNNHKMGKRYHDPSEYIPEHLLEILMEELTEEEAHRALGLDPPEPVAPMTIDEIMEQNSAHRAVGIPTTNRNDRRLSF